MKPGTDGDERFKWDMTVVMLLVLAIMFVLVVALAFGPLGHTT